MSTTARIKEKRLTVGVTGVRGLPEGHLTGADQINVLRSLFCAKVSEEQAKIKGFFTLIATAQREKERGKRVRIVYDGKSEYGPCAWHPEAIFD